MAVGSWFKVLVYPSDTFFEEKSEPTLWKAAKNIILALIVSVLVQAGILLAMVYMFKMPVETPGIPLFWDVNVDVLVLLTILPFITIALMAAILLIILIFLIESGILFVTSKILGGEGTFTIQTQLISVVGAAFIVISPLILLFSAVSFLSLIPYLYFLALLTIALREAHDYSTFRAALSWLMPSAAFMAFLFLIIIPLIPSISEEIARMELGGYSRYSDSRFGFSLNYPNGWILDNESEGIVFMRPLEEVGLLVRVEGAAGVRDATEASKFMSVESAYKAGNISYEILSSQEITVNGMRAYEVVSVAAIEGQAGMVREVFIVRYGNVYIIRYIAPSDVYPGYESTVDKCIQSLEIGDISGTSPGPAQAPLPLEGTHQTVSSPEFSYELYLPESYSADKKYPLIICLSPDGNGNEFYNSVYPTASRYGLILVGSNDFTNYRSFDYFLPKIYKTLEDVKFRVNVDEDRIYACGFSGGGMGTYVISYFKPAYFRGLMVNSGGIHEILYDTGKLQQMGVKKVVLLCGKTDDIVPCSHMRGDMQWLNASGIETHIIEFDGGHMIAPAEVYNRAINWLRMGR